MKSLALENMCDKYDIGDAKMRAELIELSKALLPVDHYLFINHCLLFHKFLNKQFEEKLKILREKGGIINRT